MVTATLGTVAARPSLLQRIADFWQRFSTTEDYSEFGRDLALYHARYRGF